MTPTPTITAKLAEALEELLNDTQHANHSCGDPNCPVSTARIALRDYRQHTEAQAAPVGDAALLGMKLVVDPTVPNEHVVFKLDGKEVGRLIGLAVPGKDRTADFPAVKEAGKCAKAQLQFYREMMQPTPPPVEQAAQPVAVYQIASPLSDDWKETPKPEYMQAQTHGNWREVDRAVFDKFAADPAYKSRVLYLHPQRGSEPLTADGCHGLDTPERVCFYEQDFYVLSNFSSFNLAWEGFTFQTSEAAYHWEKFANENDDDTRNGIAYAIYEAPSAHEAFKIAEAQKHLRRPDWDEVKVGFMRDILRAKAQQHEYVRRKLLAAGDRELVENSWRDNYWGWGPNRDGHNMLGKLWMEIRTELRAHGIPSSNGEQV
jgi:ribA/ribD-fused uncharacterized protein